MKDESFKVAIFLASATFYNILDQKGFDYQKFTKKEIFTLQKYYNRMSFRPTPFGAFSSFGLVSWGEDKDGITLSDGSGSILHLLPDLHFYFQIADDFVNTAYGHRYFFSNPTLYLLGNEYRFIKTHKKEESTALYYVLQAFNAEEVISEIILYAKIAKAFSDLAKKAAEISGSSLDDACNFIRFLIDAQILLFADHIKLIGRNVLNQDSGNTSQHSLLKSKLINWYDIRKFPSVGKLKLIAAELYQSLSNKIINDETGTFYANQQRNGTGKLNTRYQSDLLDAFMALNALTINRVNQNMDRFVEQFKLMYDLQAVPLLKVLDPETGISYGPLTIPADHLDLVRHIHFERKQDTAENLEWTRVHKLILNKWSQTNDTVIRLTEDDIQDLCEKGAENIILPPSFCLLFNIGDGELMIEAAGGLSATSLTGRFTILDDEVWRTNREIAEHERRCNPDVIFAEIGMLSDRHIDNINRRLPVYDHEIVINTPPSAELVQLHLADLQLKLVGNELILESVAFKKRVIPRLTSAFNHQNCELNIFRLLCDLPYQQVRSNFQFDTEDLFPGLEFYPRVVYKNVILSLAKWKINDSEIKAITTRSDDENFIRLQAIRIQRKITRYVSLINSDQQLVFDLDLKCQTSMFAESIKRRTAVTIREFIPPLTTPVKMNSKSMISQFVATVLNNQLTYKGYSVNDASINSEDRDFNLGTEWLYLKIYCVPAVSNYLLSSKILPIVKKSFRKFARKWFFIRYMDHSYHLRLRVLVNKDQLGTFLKDLEFSFADSLECNLIREYKADRYQREIERYGPELIRLVENVFYRSSDLVANFIAMPDDKKTTHAYYIFAFKTVYDLIELFHGDKVRQAEFLSLMIDLFLHDYGNPKRLKADIDKKYREIEKDLERALDDKQFYESMKLGGYSIKMSTAIQRLVGKIKAVNSGEKKMQKMLADLVHMHLNRLFVNQQQNQELVVYYCLCKKMKSMLARR